MAQFNLSHIFKQAFGYDAPTTDASKIKIPQAAARREQSRLGQPFYKTDLSGREFFLPVTIDGILIPFAVMGMTWKKTIVETPMPERGGAVIELINIDTYQFTLKGLLVNETNDFPDDGVMELFDLFKQNNSVTIHSVLSDIVLSGKSNLNAEDPDGHKVVIKEVTWPEVSGVEHVKPFQMQLISDYLFDLKVQ
ncbi:MAG: hypothetical protein KGM16_17860 [Bacteroidota bacterium]|nr:hypothetical protein [Bacteroidota bacterium]